MFGSYNRSLHSRRGYDKIAVLCWLVESLVQDRNFDDIAEKFSRNIYGTTKGQLRQAILWQDLEPLLAQLGPGPLRVLDAGGGEGQTAIKVAQLGHHVTLCDLSAEMVARAPPPARRSPIGRPGMRSCILPAWHGKGTRAAGLAGKKREVVSEIITSRAWSWPHQQP